ncbi:MULTISPECIES: very short patch repair endonuclease [Pseudomonas syringae group]|uniref:Very short patch repair endonuclease n=1 Tax=Pseudomonas avellanae TaxID=46257 RepID=A0AAD0GRB9_9PSED|nr:MULTISPECIES: very short patch repair endonuclease [Pseudomonas syringae group]AVB21502.1 very short patch repair endonuclease [Pseudomonas avellanae]EGH14283.1 DNA mismatch endonuclease Vsr [Pseudomonas amygdali pv. morsprunorum str. M302280]POP75441.1 very short patch repair endonuclease [Pseudomonas amygdali pv. morsprunorum]
MDNVSPSVRSRMMAGIKAKNTKPELKIRKLLHAAGYRYRLHHKKLPGKPDIVMPKYKLCIFIQGCFWHRHQGCKYTTFPKSRVEFWEKKFRETVIRDSRNVSDLIQQGWRVFELWECGIKNNDNELEEILFLITKKSINHFIWPNHQLDNNKSKSSEVRC